MFSIRGYQTKAELYESEQSLIFRAIRESDDLPVIFKVLKDVHPPPERIARFKREYQLVKALNLPGVVSVYDFSYAEGHWLFIQEDFGGESLARLKLAGRIDIGDFLSIADALSGHVAAIHQQAIIHKDLNPANIVLDRRSGVVKLIDFGIATRLSRETVAFDHPSLVEGTPAYLSPEQTGRINQPLDDRTDLYSLGCTFYALLTGQPPFEAADLLELLHCHLARVPEPAGARRPDIPPALSAIIDKLLAKNADDRYQTAHGLQADLARCRQEWQEHGRITAFAPGRQDVAQRLSPPARLYGRDAEIAELLASFERVVGGATELMMVSGHPGIGKSALVKELYRPVTRGRGFFIAGKFDQFQRDTPYGPILTALDSLIGQVLMEPPAKMAEWARALQTAAGNMLPSVVEILPRLSMLYDRFLPTVTLPAAEFKFRFIRALAGFLRVFAGPEHPLVLFIDDLQWADSASLDFLKHLMTAEPIPHMLLLGAYRHHEVPAAHPLRAALRDIRSSGMEVRELHIEPLDTDDTTALLADTLHRRLADASEPARLIHHKTGGNPFFIQTFLGTLVAEEVVFFDYETVSWQWHIDRMGLLDLSDNVVDLLIANLQKLPAQTRDLLTQAACIGNQFDLGLLAAVTGRHGGEVAESLVPALTENYLIPTSGDYRLLEAGIEDLHTRLDVSYKFAHDRIQQAAYRLSSPDTHAAIHLRIGRGMRAYFTGKSAEAQILSIVNQLNQASHLVDSVSERRDIAAMNLEAGKKAKAAVANAAALDYFERGLAFLGDSPDAEGDRAGGAHRLAPATLERSFRESYSLALALAEEAAEAAYLGADFKIMDQHIDALLSHAEQLLDRVKVVQVRINALSAQNQLPATVVAAREILKPLGIELPVDPTEADIEAQFEAVAHEMGTRLPRDLAELPDMKESEPAAALRMLNSVTLAAFLTERRLSIVIAAQMVLLSLRHGLAEESIHGFIFYGMSLCGRDRVTLGNEFGRLAEILVERSQRKSQMPDLAVLGGCYIFHWQRHLRESIQKMRDGYRAGLESGYIGPGANCLQCSSAMRFWAGNDLSEIDEEYVESAQALTKHKQGPFLNWLRQYHQAVRNFRGLSKDPLQLQGDVYDEVTEFPIHEQHGDMTSIYNVNFNKAMLGYHFHDYHGSLRHARVLEGLNQAGSIVLPMATLYQCLALLATCSDAAPETKPSILEEASALVDRMKRWSESCPFNYAHKFHLMAAELARVSGQPKDAREHYDIAVELARQNEFTQEEGLALERAALFYLEQRKPRLAGYYMRDAYYTYGRWGAAAKREYLRRHYGYLLEREQSTRARVTTQAKKGEIRRATTTSELDDLDLGTVLAATRAIAKETDVGRLLQTVMRVSLENAGAERGYLILVRDEQLLVKVRGELGEEARFESVSLALNDQEGLARSVVHYVARTAEPVLLEHAAEKGLFVSDPYIRQSACKSLLCVPILNQGSMVAISYLENNRAASVFNEDRLDVLTLLMGQAAVSIESALLKAADDVRDFHFRVGGSLPADSPAYVRRKADDLLAANVKQGEFAYVFNTRQMGKSSLRVRAVDRLSKAGVACVSIDITSIGSRDVTAEQWYAGVARTLVIGLGLQKDFDLRRWWRDKAELSPVQRLDVLVDEVLIDRVEKPIAVFIDEVDAVLSLDFSPDDFFALIRLFYNRRADDPRYQRLCFVLLGVATPTDLIRDRRRTPFNIGRAIPLSGFRYDEAKSLLPGLSRVGDGERILRAVLDWSGGQPFLTQKLCRLVVEDESRPPAGKERDWVANLVHARVIDKWRHRDEPDHLKTIEARILSAPDDVAALLTLYQQILNQGEVDAGESPLETTLLLSGLVTQAFDKLHVGNPIYAAVFGNEWIDAGLAARKPWRPVAVTAPAP
jgi:predicted ATPase/GAF domain-containing protein